MVELKQYVQEPFRTSTEWRQVDRVADALLNELNAAPTQARIAKANAPGTSSAEIQAAFQPFAEALGFSSERSGLLESSISGLRPDYYLPLGESGIILEVERGKTTTNNMDLLDFWKCHICEVAAYLFLLVPKALQHNPKMKPKNEFTTVSRRLQPFFEPANYTNVRGLCLFGY